MWAVLQSCAAYVRSSDFDKKKKLTDDGEGDAADILPDIGGWITWCRCDYPQLIDQNGGMVWNSSVI
jgi:hypothetical protein